MRVTRRHGHLLRTGGTPVPSADAADAPLCSTVWAHGVFASHVCLGNTSFNKLLSVARDSYGIVNDSGLRLAVQIDGDSEWQRLGVPSLFEMGIDDVRWVYKHDRGTFEVVSRASGGRIQFAVFVTDGPAVAVKMTAHLVCGDREHEKPGTFSSDQNAGRFTFRPAADTLFAGAYPDAGFDLTFDEPDQLVSLGQLDNLPWATATTTATTQLRFSIGGALTRDTRDADPVSHVPAPLRLETDGPAAALADALPWFEHCAGIHRPLGMAAGPGRLRRGPRDLVRRVCQPARPRRRLAAVVHAPALRADRQRPRPRRRALLADPRRGAVPRGQQRLRLARRTAAVLRRPNPRAHPRHGHRARAPRTRALCRGPGLPARHRPARLRPRRLERQPAARRSEPDPPHGQRLDRRALPHGSAPPGRRADTSRRSRARGTAERAGRPRARRLQNVRDERRRRRRFLCKQPLARRRPGSPPAPFRRDDRRDLPPAAHDPRRAERAVHAR